MSSTEKCPNCDNIYGNEPRKIPCGHIVCHKCCLELFNKDNNTLVCPVCDEMHTFKSKNIFKKSLQQVAHFGFGKKTSIREVGFASIMPVEKASCAEKSANKEVKKAAANLPTAPPGAPPEAAPQVISSPPPPPPSPPPPPPPPAPTPVPMPIPVFTEPEQITATPKPITPVPLMSTRPTVPDNILKVVKQPQPMPNNVQLPSLLNKTPTSSTPPPDPVKARCHSCSNIRHVIVCDHCEHFVCLPCAEEHRASTISETQDLVNKWQQCKTKYNVLLKKLNQYNCQRTQIDSDLAAIRVAVEQRSQDAIQNVISHRDLLCARINEHIEKEQTMNSIKHNDLANEFRQIQNRIDSALKGEDIGPYTQDDFLRDIRALQDRMNKRQSFIETYTLQIPTISRYERVSIEKLLGELRFNAEMINPVSNRNTAPLSDDQHTIKANGFCETSKDNTFLISSDSSQRTSSPVVHPTMVHNHGDTSTNVTSNIRPLMSETPENTGVDLFDEFRRRAALIHQLFNAPYSKVTNAPTVSSSKADTTSHTSNIGKNPKPSSSRPDPKAAMSTIFVKSWRIEYTAVPNFLCLTPNPTPRLFILDKYGKVSVCTVPPKASKLFESYTLFPAGTDEVIESAVASTHFLIVYSRKKQDTMSGTMYFFNHDCKPVLPNGIHQNIPVHHILCDQNANRLYCLDRMRCTIYYHVLPNNIQEIETCMKTRRDFLQFNSSYSAFKMLQNDDILGFYERNECTVHFYNKKTAAKIDEFKCEHFMDKYESWGIIAIRKDNNNLIFKIDEREDHDAVNRQHIVYEVNRFTKQIIAQVQQSSVFGMIIGPNNEVILGIRQSKDSGVIQCYTKK